MAVLLVHGLARHAENPGDGLPRPALGTGTVDVGGLELLEQSPQGGDGPETDLGLLAVDVSG